MGIDLVTSTVRQDHQARVMKAQVANPHPTWIPIKTPTYLIDT